MQIKERDFEDGQSIINCIQQGKANRRDLIALLMYVREDLPDDMIKDLAHCVAHSTRDRGYAYEHITRVIASFIEMLLLGSGELFIEPVFPIDELVDNLIADLSGIGFDVVPSKIQANAGLIEVLLRDILAGTVIALDREYFRACRFATITLNEVTKLRFDVQFHNRPDFKNERYAFMAKLQWSFPVFNADETIICNPIVSAEPTAQ